MANVDWRMKGQYLKNCNCIASCPCDTEGFPYPGPGCEGVVAMHIVQGHYANVRLDGLRWAAAVYWPGALHEGNGTMQPFVDERATQEQRNALLQILSGSAGGTLFEILKVVVSTVHEPKFVPIHFEFDKAKRRARLSIAGLVETVTEPLTVPATGAEQHTIVRMPNGFEYKEMEVARATVLKSQGAVQFDLKNRHSSLAEVEHTPTGLAS